MMGAVLVSAFESTGAHFATARLAGATPPPASVLSRSVGLQVSFVQYKILYSYTTSQSTLPTPIKCLVCI
jgi:hypothetical protein